MSQQTSSSSSPLVSTTSQTSSSTSTNMKNNNKTSQKNHGIIESLFFSCCEDTSDAYSSNTNNRRPNKVSVVLLNYRIGETVLERGNLSAARSGENNKKIPEEFIDIFKNELQEVCSDFQQPLLLDFTPSTATSIPPTTVTTSSSAVPTVYWYLTKGSADRAPLSKLNDNRIRYLIIEKSARLFDEYDSYSINDLGDGPEDEIPRTHYDHHDAVNQIVQRIIKKATN